MSGQTSSIAQANIAPVFGVDNHATCTLHQRFDYEGNYLVAVLFEY